MDNSKKPKILVVEDELIWQKNLLRCEFFDDLRTVSKDAIVIANNYQSAKESLDSGEKFDLAITDVFLKDQSNQFEWNSLARLLQKKNVPIIVVSAYLDDADYLARMVNDFQVVGIFHKTKLDPYEFSNHVRRVLSVGANLNHDISSKSDITWLHLSDLHYRDSGQFDRSVVVNALWRDLRRWRESGISPDFIVLTGDIAYSGVKSEYDLASDFLDEVLEKTEVSKERLFLVPGNHDVDRSNIAKLAQKTTDALSDRESVRDILKNPHSRNLYMTRLSGYTDFVNKYFSDVPGYVKFSRSRYFYVRKLNLENFRIGIMGLNSAWSSGNAVLDSGKVHDKGNLVMGEKQVREAIDQLSGVDFRIALMHHPLSYLRDFDCQDVLRLLGRRCDFLLRGHLHESDFERKTSLQGELVIIPSGALYQDRKLVNSYNLVVLDPERKRARVLFRRYSDLQEEWLKDLDVTGEDNDGELVFNLIN